MVEVERVDVRHHEAPFDENGSSVADRFSVDLPAGRFSYLEHGQGDPIVFLHALGRDASDWLTVMEMLDTEWRCIALDQRGHGQSVRPGEYSFEHLEADFRDFINRLGLDQFVLVAHSMGGTVGWLFAEKTPERLEALIVEDTQIPIDRHEYPEVPAFPPEPVAYDWEVRRQLFRQLNSPDPAWWDNVSKITPPTLLIAGSESEELEEIARILPDGELITTEAGHWIHEAEPELFVEAMRSFLGVRR